MTERTDHDDPDELLLAELRGHYLRTDPVPVAVLRGARAAIELRDLDAQLAELLRDTAVEDKELVGVRGIGQRLLTFGRGDQFVEVDVATDGDRRSLSGYVVPAQAGTLTVEHAAGNAAVDVDAQGRFRSAAVPRGPIRLRIELPGLPSLLTPWVAL